MRGRQRRGDEEVTIGEERGNGRAWEEGESSGRGQR